MGRVGCGLSILGSSIIVLHAPEEQEIETITQFWEYAVAPGPQFNPLQFLSSR